MTKDYDQAPLAHPRLAGIHIPLHYACNVARVLDTRDRHAAIWLANLAANWRRISLVWHRRGLPTPITAIGAITADQLASRLGLSTSDVRAALTNPDAERGRFTKAVETFRAEFEAAIPTLADTDSGREIARAWAYTGRQADIVEIRGLWRHGKTEQSEALWLRNLHNTVWFDCPSDATEMNFLTELARAVGVGSSGAKKARQLRPTLKLCFGPGMIERMVGDETHNLLPTNLKSRPARIEYLRELNLSTGLAILLLTTEQYELSMSATAQGNSRWAVGQWKGRVTPFQLPETHTDRDLKAIVRIHAPELTGARLVGGRNVFDALAIVARSDEGYLGTMVRVIRRGRELAGGPLQDEHIFSAIAEHTTALAKAKQAKALVPQIKRAA